MKFSKSAGIVVLASLLLTACDSGAKSIDWYKSHDAERNQRYDECTKLSEPRATEDCRNAIDASFRSGSLTKSEHRSW